MTFVRSLASVFTVLCLGLAGCEDRGVESAVPHLAPSKYSYKAYTSGGVLAVVGTVNLAKADSTTVNGTWALESVLSGVQVGPQIGAGTLVGGFTDSKCWFNLNPGWSDNNVFLAGSVEADRIVGTWTWITFAGPTTNGSFEAVRTK
jgi:hypothetical protein